MVLVSPGGCRRHWILIAVAVGWGGGVAVDDGDMGWEVDRVSAELTFVARQQSNTSANKTICNRRDSRLVISVTHHQGFQIAYKADVNPVAAVE